MTKNLDKLRVLRIGDQAVFLHQTKELCDSAKTTGWGPPAMQGNLRAPLAQFGGRTQGSNSSPCSASAIDTFLNSHRRSLSACAGSVTPECLN